MGVPSSSSFSSENINLRNITPENIDQVRSLHLALFPVHYNDKFFDHLLQVGEFAKLAYWGDTCVGLVCCRLENDGLDRSKLYMMTLGVLHPYRHRGIAHRLVDHILYQASLCDYISSIYLHVQTVNEAALSFYRRNGFEVIGYVENYYKNIPDKHAYIVSRPNRPRT
ncbi:acyl-CoA N-acyltransferase [Radiomyces spectabilis]|uniref:acyl-CoA N-acyltransferase n=1 Tax=Radiomyces spectabilis TaxID=64574 RepID=UPI00221E7252|nr:acyl-CoA N-acyltransferase [Radiomyces spectabilis]KAI8379566.1 acyl-CoA N-acyltransferase [Radiomyces spectabilis]